jgi:outer membrane protein OmpA-like peptidoglycan-associated protein
MKNNGRIEPLLTLCASLLLLSGCASKLAVNSELDAARIAYERASANPEVSEFSKQEWQRAHQSFTAADRAWRDKKGKGVVTQQAYLAHQQILIAEQTAAARVASEDVGQLRLLHSQTVAGLRADEAQAARLEAARLAEEANRLQREVAAREARLAARTAELEALKELQAKHTDRGMVLTLGDVLFDTDKATLKSGAIQNIDKVAGFMRKYDERTVLIEGHTDNTGDPEYNLELSINRALAIKGALEARGVDSARIDTSGLGEEQPVASNDSAAGRQLNRRVEIVFEDDTQSLTAAIEE